MLGIKHRLEHFRGLSICTVCGAGEGELLKWCPGFKLTEEDKEACFQGDVVDLDYFRSRLEYEERQRVE